MIGAAAIQEVAALSWRKAKATKLVRRLSIAALVFTLLLVAATALPAPANKTTYRYGVVGSPITTLRAVAQAPARTDIVFVAEPDDATTQADLRTGRISAALIDNDIVTAPGGGSTAAIAPLKLAATRATQAQHLEEHGATPAAALRTAILLNQPPRTSNSVAKVVVLLMIVALMYQILAVATGIQTERGTQMADMLLVPMEPIDIIVGKVVGQQLWLLASIAFVTVPSIALALSLHGLHILDQAPDAAGIAMWLILQLALFGFAAAASGATVAGPDETQRALMPLSFTVPILASAAIASTAHANGIAWTVLSMVPPTAPPFMLLRVATVNVPAWQIVIAVTLTTLAAVGAAKFAALVYLGAVVGSNSKRIGVRDAFRAGRVLQRARTPNPSPLTVNDAQSN